MKGLFYHIFILSMSLVVVNQALSQGGAGTNAFNGGYLGWNTFSGANPLTIRTNNVTRMHINGNIGTTSGFIGIGTTNPQAPMHILGTVALNGQGWTRGLTLANGTAVNWEGSSANFFMAHASSSPAGNWFAGSGTGGAASYSSSVFVGSSLGTSNPLLSTLNFKNFLVHEPAFDRRLGVNTLSPQASAEFYSNTTQLRLSYGPAITNGSGGAIPTVFTDFKTNPSGHLEIDAQGNAAGTGNRVGIETNGIAVGNTLHINSILLNATTGNGFTPVPGLVIPTGTSGLRFEDLRSSSVPQLNPSTNVLSVNSNGDVILVPGGGSNPFVTCASTANADLTANSRSNLNNFNLYFLNGNSNGFFENQISIGYPCNTLLQGKLNVLNTVQNTGNSVFSDFSGISVGQIAGVSARARGAEYATGISGLAQQAVFQSIGVRGRGVNSYMNMGVLGSAQHFNSTGFAYGGHFSSISPTNDQNVGVYGHAVNTNTNPIAVYNFGGYFHATSTVPVKNIGIYGEGSYVAGYFAGNTITNGIPIVLSDSTLKENVLKESNALTNLLRLRPVTYSMKQAQNPALNLASGLQHGFIAQEVETQFPELVQVVNHPAQYDSLGVETAPERIFKGMNYNGLISLNTQAILDLNQKVENLSLSDQSIKVNVVDLSNSLDMVLDMRGVSFDWTNSAQTDLNLESTNQIGFIAQEIQLIDPRLTFIGSDSLLHVKYEKVVPILVGSIQDLYGKIQDQQDVIDEQTNTISDLNHRLTQLENCLSGILPFLCQLSNSAIEPTDEEVQVKLRAIMDVQLSDKNSIILNQNVPNPFAESTIITYSVPASVQRAQIHFYDMKGTLINSVDISERGEGQLNVYANDLSSGIYTYSLVADGKIISTKKMMKN